MNKINFIPDADDMAKNLAIEIKKNKIVLIKISASWCGPCQNKNFLESYHKLKSNYANHDDIKFIEFDVDNDSEIIENKKYYNIEVVSVPTFIIAKNGNFTRKFEGGGYLDEINKYIADAINSS